MSRGVFRYELSGVTTRRVPGEFGFVVQCNPKRHTHRRTPASMASLVQDFNPSLFNFNQIREEEVGQGYSYIKFQGLSSVTCLYRKQFLLWYQINERN